MKTSFLSLKITPPIGVPLAGNGREDSRSRGIHDDLFANFAYLETDGQKHLFIGMDLLGIKRCDADAIKMKIGQNCGILPKSITIAATHTHSGPNTVEIFETFLTDEDMDACKVYRQWLVEAVSSAAPAVVAAAAVSKMGFGCDRVEGFSYNRRVLMKDGSLRMVFEDYDRSQISSLAGPNGDPMMHVFVFADSESKIKGLMIQYTSHPAVVCGQDWLYSRDYIHKLTQELKQRYGKDTVVVYMNGAQGNQVAADPTKPFITGFAEADRVGAGLAKGAALIIDRILSENAFVQDVPFMALTSSVSLPIRSIMPEEAERARNMLRSCKTGAQLHGLDPRVEAQSILEMAEFNKENEETLIQAIRIGEVLIVTFPGEVFLEHAKTALRNVPFKDAMIFGLANDYVGYIPTIEAFEQGGYEVKTSYASSRYDPSAGELLTSAASSLIKSLT